MTTLGPRRSIIDPDTTNQDRGRLDYATCICYFGRVRDNHMREHGNDIVYVTTTPTYMATTSYTWQRHSWMWQRHRSRENDIRVRDTGALYVTRTTVCGNIVYVPLRGYFAQSPHYKGEFIRPITHRRYPI